MEEAVAHYMSTVWGRQPTQSDPYAFIDETCEVVTPMFEGVGPSALRHIDELWIRAFSSGRLVDYTLFRKGDTLALHWSAEGTNDGPLGHFEPTGRHCAIAGMTLIRERDHRAVLFEDHINMLEVYNQLGIAMDPEGSKTYLAHLQATERLNHTLGLTLMESRILSYYVHGWSAKEIAEATGSSHRTVERHVANVMKKSAVHSRSGLMDMVYAKGLHLYLRTIFDTELASSAKIV